MKKLNFLKLGIISLLVASCATNNRESQAELKKLIATNNFQKAVELTSSPTFLDEKNSELLHILERGRALFLNQNYYQALQQFDRAHDLSDQLFTVSISKKVASVIANDNADNYYGDAYERSLIRYYQSLTHMMLYKKGEYEAYILEEPSADGKSSTKKDVAAKVLSPQEVKFHLTAAKSMLLDWDSYLTSVRAVTGGVVTFKDDLMAKVYGAFIHENTGEASDLQVAKDLYKAAKDLLLKNYDIYPSYNSKYVDFRKNFDHFAQMPIDQVEKNYVTKTDFHKDLLAYIDQKLADLSKGTIHNCLFIV